MTADNNASRRPLASRQTGWAQIIAKWLARTPLTPNGISMLGMVFAAISGIAFAASLWLVGSARVAVLVLAAVAIQLRLLCNLFDGMVAVEGGKATADGPFWNEFPDRISDIAILVGAGVGAGAMGLGWTAATFAVLTAYVRELGHASGQTPDFSGPLGKPQRMALLTLAACIAACEPLLDVDPGWTLTAALWAILVGTAFTVVRRAMRQIADLRRR